MSVLLDIDRVLMRARCCRDWPVYGVLPMGRCGYCNERPEVVGPWEEAQ